MSTAADLLAAAELVWWADVVPQHMRERPQWVAWGPDPVTGRDKCPLIIDATGRRASSTDATTWRPWAAARAHYERHAGARRGVGYVFTPADGLVFVDVDDCLERGGELLKPWAVPLVALFRGRTYIERSPSRRGLHIFVRGVGPEAGKAIEIGDGGVEVYTRGRYSTITGDVYDGSDLLDEAQDAIDSLLALFAPRSERRRAAKPVERSGDRDAEIAAEALRKLDPDMPYSDWVRAGMAVHARFPDGTGFAMWNEWSAGGRKYRGERDLETHWRSFTAGKGIGFGTLVAMGRRGRA